MSVVGLFAGIGGLEEGFRAAGFHTSLLAEVDEAATAVLRTRFPGIAIAGDVRRLESLPVGTKVILAGFPCQDLSPPGAKTGIDGARSGLVSEAFRLAAATPTLEWLILENVHFMLQLDRGRAMSRIVARVDALGWNWAYRTLDAICVLPQRRRRVVMAISPRHDPREILFRDDYPAIDDREPGTCDAAGFYWTEGRSGSGLRREAVPTLKVGSSLGISSAPGILLADERLGTPTIEDAERLQGFSAGWTSPAEGMGRGSRWRLVGNAVPPPVAKWVADGIINPGRWSTCVAGRILAKRDKWPDAAYGLSGEDQTALSIGEAFTAEPRPLLSSFLRDPLVGLSSRAIRGFVSRARGGGLRWPDGFLDRVEAHA